MASPAVFPKCIETAYLYHCPSCRQETLGRWRDEKGNLIAVDKLKLVLGARLIYWKKDRLFEASTNEKLTRRSGSYGILVFEDGTLRICSLKQDQEPVSPRKGHFCDDDAEVHPD